MKAALYEKYGTTEVLQIRTIDEEQPSSKEVRIIVQASTVTPMDWKFRSGKVFLARLMSGIRKPKNPILGVELSGVIDRVGVEVTTYKPGDKVYAVTTGGGHSESVCLPTKQILKAPTKITLDEAASIPFGATTAYHFLKNAAGIKSGDKVLVNGASGGVGIFAIQLCKIFGADVTGVCSTGNVEMVKSLGADRVIDYKQADFLHEDETYDIIFDVVGNKSYKNCKSKLKEKGTYLTTILTFSVLYHMFLTMKSKKKQAVFTLPPFPPMDALAEVTKLVEAGQLKTVIGRSFELDQIKEAHTYAETGHAVGKVLIKINNENGVREVVVSDENE